MPVNWLRQGKFVYSASELSSLEHTLSQDRLDSYRLLANGDSKRAIQLYERNTAISSALYVPLQGVEVALRNSIHATLRADFSRDDWYSQLPLLKPQADALGAARSTLTRNGKPHEPRRIIAELSFGFWVGLIGKGYSRHGLWNKHLHKAFPNQKLQRGTCHSTLDRIRYLRNRVAHHEPILSRDLLKDHNDLLEVAGWICGDTRSWIAQQSRVPTLVRSSSYEQLRKKLGF